MKLLITGFDPFGGESKNPAYEAIKQLPDKIHGVDIVKLEVPTVFFKSAQIVEEAIQTHKPDIVINVGQAGGRPCVTIEKVAINYVEASIPDNEGNQPFGIPLEEDGETAYFTTLPIKAMVEHVESHHLPCKISYTAGTYVCNSLMYQVLSMTTKKYPHIRAGFIHVPFLPEQAAGKNSAVPSMSLELIRDSLFYAIEAAVTHTEDTQHAIHGCTH